VLSHRFFPLALTFAGVLLASSAEAGDGALVSVSATVLSKSNCKFTTSTASVPFGSMDAAMSADRVVPATLNYRCQGSAPVAAFAFSTDDGLHEAGPGLPRMRHATVLTEYLPYSLGLSPVSGTINKGVVGTLTLTGTVTPASVANAVSGSFSDTVTVTLLP
jgi:spore coat protein U-like protein